MLEIVQHLGMRYANPDSTHRRNYVKVKCTCGAEYAIRSDEVKQRKSCIYCHNHKKIQIPIGETFGRLTIIEDLGNPGPKRERKVRALCSCGNTKDVLWRTVRDGSCRSCGCLLQEARKKQKRVELLSN
ncbi:hypothetical protein CN918_25525 [Priestia megaterium]|nr:hypothetical protein CN918_25525 [Priestia megaterium]